MNENTLSSSRLDGRAAVWAGIVAGLVFMALEMMLVPLALGGSPWGPPRMIAAIGMGQEVLPPPATFDFGILMVAMMIHLVLSVVYAFVFGFVARGRAVGMATLLGAVFGLALYLVNFHGFTAVFPWFAEARNWVSILSHLVYGAVLGWTYARCAGPRATVAPTLP